MHMSESTNAVVLPEGVEPEKKKKSPLLDLLALIVSAFALLGSVFSYNQSEKFAEAANYPHLDVTLRTSDLVEDKQPNDDEYQKRCLRNLDIAGHEDEELNTILEGRCYEHGKIPELRGMRIDNSGTGPALIDSVELFGGGIRAEAVEEPIKCSAAGDTKYMSLLRLIGQNQINLSGVEADKLDQRNPQINALYRGMTLAEGFKQYLIGYDRNLLERERQNIAKIGIRIKYKSLTGKQLCVLYWNDKGVPNYLRRDECINAKPEKVLPEKSVALPPAEWRHFGYDDSGECVVTRPVGTSADIAQ